MRGDATNQVTRAGLVRGAFSSEKIGRIEKGGAKSDASQTSLEDEKRISLDFVRELRADAKAYMADREGYDKVRHDGGAGRGGFSRGRTDGVTDLYQAQPPKLPNLKQMTPQAVLDEITAGWAKLNDAERLSIALAFRGSMSIKGKTHESILPAVGEEKSLVSRGEAARRLRINIFTLDRWRKRGWITGEVRLSNTIWFPASAVYQAKRRAKTRKRKK